MGETHPPILRLDKSVQASGLKTIMAAAVVQQAPGDSPALSASRDSSSSRNSKGSQSSDFAHRLPTEEELAACADIAVYGGDGKSVPFKAFYERGVERQRHLVIFVRHFFCGVSHLTFTAGKANLTYVFRCAKITCGIW